VQPLLPIVAKDLANMRTVILGLGNLLLADEGVGVHAAHILMERGCPDDTVVLDIGTAILDALPALEQAERVIVLDAVKADGKPGSVYCMPFSDFARSPCIASMHGFDLARVLALLGRTDPPQVLVLGVEPARIEWSMELSPEVAAALPTLLEAVREELG
jgi:hydrogenase maturation protease